MDYGRLVSYIYQYENGIKGKNIGFAKVETRNRQCKISINLKGVYTDNPVNYSVYLFVNNTDNISGIKIGEILVRNGIGTLQEIIYNDNINGTGYSYNEISGLFIAYRNNTEDMFISQWTDEQINLNNISFDARKETQNVSDSEELIQVEAAQVHCVQEEQLGIDGLKEEQTCIQEAQEENYMQIQQELKLDIPQEEQIKAEILKEEQLQSETLQKEQLQSDMLQEEQLQSETMQEEQLQAEILQEEQLELQISQEEESLEVKTNSASLKIDWFDTHDIIDAFEDDEYYDCIEICPDDLKAIDISEIDVQNNSFLMHGYYNFKHLLFGKVNRNAGENNYFIGVPGIYSNRERFMASMYGFNNFRRSHRSDCRNPYFGYWYIEIYA